MQTETKEQLRIKRELEASQKLKHDQGITDQESANDDKPKSLKDIKKMVADQKKMQGKTNTTLTQKDQLKKKLLWIRRFLLKKGLKHNKNYLIYLEIQQKIEWWIGVKLLEDHMVFTEN